jgi:hypothetical protein
MDYFTLMENVLVYVIDSHRPYSAQNIVNDSAVRSTLFIMKGKGGKKNTIF